MLTFLENFDLTIYILYTLLTAAVVYVLVAMAVKVFSIGDPRLRAWLFMLPLLLPVIGYLFLCPMSGQGCSQGNLLWFQLERLLCRLAAGSPLQGSFFLLVLASVVTGWFPPHQLYFLVPVQACKVGSTGTGRIVARLAGKQA